MLMRVGLLLMVTGLAFIVAGWLGAIGPALIIIGSGCAAVAFEALLADEHPVAPEQPVAVDLPEAITPAPTSGTHRAA